MATELVAMLYGFVTGTLFMLAICLTSVRFPIWCLRTQKKQLDENMRVSGSLHSKKQLEKFNTKFNELKSEGF